MGVIAKQKSTFFVIGNKLFLFDPSLENKLQLVKGKFQIDNDNNLVYIINKSSNWRREYRLPEKINFKGKWKLDNNHDLVLDLKETEEFDIRRLHFKGKIVRVEGDSLTFQIKSKSLANREEISFLKLKGLWQADKFNRITFEVKKKVKPDTLIFKGVWSLNKSQEIIYAYKKTHLKKKIKAASALTFKGFWQINEKNRLRFILSSGQNSFFDFRGYIESPSVYPKKGVIKYRLGVGLKEERKEKVISLYGVWKFSRKLGLTFDMDYGEGKVKRIQFKVSISLKEKDKIIFKLIDNNNKPLGITVIFKPYLLTSKDLEYFLELKKKGKDSYMGGGVTYSF